MTVKELLHGSAIPATEKATCGKRSRVNSWVLYQPLSSEFNSSLFESAPYITNDYYSIFHDQQRQFQHNTIKDTIFQEMFLITQGHTQHFKLKPNKSSILLYK